MRFENCPEVLKDLITEFAYGTKWKLTSENLETCLTVRKLDISPMFLRQSMWSWEFCTFLPNPCRVFMPIKVYTGRWSDMIDWHAVNELLFRLDFRRNTVSVGGTRQKWFEKFRENWLSIKLFDYFVTFLLSTNAKCFKPTYAVQRADGLSGTNSPFTSARWLLEDYNVWGHF